MYRWKGDEEKSETSRRLLVSAFYKCLVPKYCKKHFAIPQEQLSTKTYPFWRDPLGKVTSNYQRWVSPIFF
jgi:hypothetical protein